MKEVRWERMFPDELEAAFENCPLVYFTYGLCEPHGPQCTVGLDALKAHGIACRSAFAHGGIVAPPDYWHIHELGGYALWGGKNSGSSASLLADVHAALAAFQKHLLPDPSGRQHGIPGRDLAHRALWPELERPQDDV